MSKWDYGIGEAGNRVVALMEAAMRFYQNGIDETMRAIFKEFTEKERKEFAEVYEDGVRVFEKSSVGICPLQRVMVGVRYTLRALKEWREKGALYGNE